MTASSVALSFPDSCPILGKMFTGYGDFFKQFGSSVALDNADLDNAGHDYVNTSGLPLASSRRTGGPGKPLGIPLAPLDQPLLNEPLPCGGYRLIPDTFAPGISDEWWCYTANPFFTFAGRQVQSFSAPEPCQLQAMYNPTTCASTKLMFRLHNELSPGTYTVDVYLALLTSRGQFLGNGVGFGAPLLAYGPAAQLYGAPAPSVTFVAGGVPPEASFTWVMPDRLVD